MKRFFVFLSFVLISLSVSGQEFKVEYDKKGNFSQYKTFQMGDGEIITPKDLREVPDAKLHEWVRKAIFEELTKKGLTKVDSGADLVVSYIAGSQPRSDAGNLGPLGMTPGTTSQTYMRDYNQGSLIVDLNTKNNTLIWRINAATSSGNVDAESLISHIINKGFKKFPKKSKGNK